MTEFSLLRELLSASTRINSDQSTDWQLLDSRINSPSIHRNPQMATLQIHFNVFHVQYITVKLPQVEIPGICEYAYFLNPRGDSYGVEHINDL